MTNKISGCCLKEQMTRYQGNAQYIVSWALPPRVSHATVGLSLQTGAEAEFRTLIVAKAPYAEPHAIVPLTAMFWSEILTSSPSPSSVPKISASPAFNYRTWGKASPRPSPSRSASEWHTPCGEELRRVGRTRMETVFPSLTSMRSS